MRASVARIESLIGRNIRAVDSMVKASTPEPVGPHPLWKKKTGSPLGGGAWRLPAYAEHVANELIKAGHPESEAVAMSIGIIRRWAHGQPSGGEKKVHPDTVAAAQKALSEWETLKAATKHGAHK